MITTVCGGRQHPCKGCTARYPACSDHCTKPEYLAYKAEQETIRKNRAACKGKAVLFRQSPQKRYITKLVSQR